MKNKVTPINHVTNKAIPFLRDRCRQTCDTEREFHELDAVFRTYVALVSISSIASDGRELAIFLRKLHAAKIHCSPHRSLKSWLQRTSTNVGLHQSLQNLSEKVCVLQDFHDSTPDYSSSILQSCSSMPHSTCW